MWPFEQTVAGLTSRELSWWPKRWAVVCTMSTSGRLDPEWSCATKLLRCLYISFQCKKKYFSLIIDRVNSVVTRVSYIPEFMFYIEYCVRRYSLRVQIRIRYLIGNQGKWILDSCSRSIAMSLSILWASSNYSLATVTSFIAVKKQSKHRDKGNDLWNVKKYDPTMTLRLPLMINMMITLLYYIGESFMRRLKDCKFNVP